MKHRVLGAAVAIIIGSSAVVTACSSGETSSSPPGTTVENVPGELQGGSDNGLTHTGSAPTTPSSPPLAKPTVQQLNERLDKAFDPNVPNVEKINWIESAERDPYLVANLADAANRQNVKIEVTNVQDPKDGKLKADADVSINGSNVDNAYISFVAENGEWKVDHTFACNIVKAARIESAACQE